MTKLAFWNSLDLNQPPEKVCQIKISLSDAMKLEKIFQSASSVFEDLNKLSIEASLLSRMIWKLKRKHHTDKALRRIETVNRGLLKYLALDLKSIYKTFERLLPDIPKGGKVFSASGFPSLQMLQWILVRTQGFARLFCFVTNSCEEAGHLWLEMAKTGGRLQNPSSVLGILGRIWTICKYILLHCCNWYNELLPYQDILKSFGERWLPINYKLPEDIKLWLNMPHITDTKLNKETTIEREPEMWLSKFLDMSDDENSSAMPTADFAPKTMAMDHVVDIGESVSRGEIKRVPEECKVSNKWKHTNLKNNETTKFAEVPTSTYSVRRLDQVKKNNKQSTIKRESEIWLSKFLDMSDDENGSAKPTADFAPKTMAMDQIVDVGDSVSGQEECNVSNKGKHTNFKNNKTTKFVEVPTSTYSVRRFDQVKKKNKQTTIERESEMWLSKFLDMSDDENGSAMPTVDFPPKTMAMDQDVDVGDSVSGEEIMPGPEECKVSNKRKHTNVKNNKTTKFGEVPTTSTCSVRKLDQVKKKKIKKEQGARGLPALKTKKVKKINEKIAMKKKKKSLLLEMLS